MDKTPDDPEGSEGPALPCGMCLEMPLPSQAPPWNTPSEEQPRSPLVTLPLGLLAGGGLGSWAASVEAEGRPWVPILRLQPAPPSLLSCPLLIARSFHCQQRLQLMQRLVGLLLHPTFRLQPGR